MHTPKQIPSQRVFMFLLTILSLAQPVRARSVYVITDKVSTVKAYHIVGRRIEYPTPAENLPNNGFGAVALALDPNSETLFVSYEYSNIIEMVNARTMIYEENPVQVPGADGLAGIAFDQDSHNSKAFSLWEIRFLTGLSPIFAENSYNLPFSNQHLGSQRRHYYEDGFAQKQLQGRLIQGKTLA